MYKLLVVDAIGYTLVQTSTPPKKNPLRPRIACLVANPPLAAHTRRMHPVVSLKYHRLHIPITGLVLHQFDKSSKAIQWF